ncbi:MAG: UDP-glucose 6-dehydrogenase [Gemmatimonadaceae bacterium 4484_173]|nr:MAG: UDP-glucose 6-dehydrogenase [Gemmatimonadaceae bacterium 4484_173]RKZ04647.1 MAG: UDP-glucose 6-dehydrogenase [Candidatus Fermentibacteria bacterium]
MKIAVVGSGYVGLVAAACLAEMGNTVICVDNNHKKIDDLKQGKLPIYEPGLDVLIDRNVKEQRLNFSVDTSMAVKQSSIIFIAVGTPPEEDGSADLHHVLAVAGDIGKAMNDSKIVVNKSTVPVGTFELVAAEVSKYTDFRVDVVSNPEFLKEGAAIDDFMKPDRIVIGTGSEEVAEVMKELYSPFVRTNNPVYIMSNKSAELTKYVANSLLATKISFMNEIANLCDVVGADVKDIRKGIGSDTRIGPHFIFPGVGFGGSCFPKDVKALRHTSDEHGYHLRILEAVTEVNRRQKQVLGSKVTKEFGEDLSGLTFGIWGLSFKPNTDDMRDAPSVVIINELLERGAQVKAYDPEATEYARTILGDTVEYCSSSYDAVDGSDALILVTEWTEFREPDFNRMITLLRRPVIFDGRNIWNPGKLTSRGFTYYGIGRG